MGWKGAAIGGAIGSMFGGWLGALAGGFAGDAIERNISKDKQRLRRNFTPQRDAVFLASAAAMLAKMAKADGHVSRAEIVQIEKAFTKLGFSPAARAYAIKVFRKAKDDNHSIYEYAADFAQTVRSVEVREFLYGLLWDLACADGVISDPELAILRNITQSLAVRPSWFNYHARMRLRNPPPDINANPLAEAFQLLGAKPSDDDETLRKAYREKAKKYHPDALRAQGLPDEMVAKATDMMSRINDAWDRIKKARGM